MYVGAQLLLHVGSVCRKVDDITLPFRHSLVLYWFYCTEMWEYDELIRSS